MSALCLAAAFKLVLCCCRVLRHSRGGVLWHEHILSSICTTSWIVQVPQSHAADYHACSPLPLDVSFSNQKCHFMGEVIGTSKHATLPDLDAVVSWSLSKDGHVQRALNISCWPSSNSLTF